MLAYIIKSSILLTLLYGSFAMLLSRETFHRFNRMALLSVLLASLVLPAVQITMPKPDFLRYEEATTPSYAETHRSATAQPAVIDSPTAAVMPPRQAEVPRHLPTLAQTLQAVYLIGMLVSACIFLWQLLGIWQDIRGGMRVNSGKTGTVVIRGGSFAPYSFLHYIIICADDYEHLRRPILEHEQAHIRFLHSFDLLLLEAVKILQWFNPFVYLLGRDLKALHEYEADSAVLSSGIDAKTYQLLLVTKAVGNRLQTVCNNLSHHSLKKRIKMMHTNKSKRWRMAKAAVLPALMLMAVVAFAKPKTDAAFSPEDRQPTRIDEVDVTQKDVNPRMLKAYNVPNDAPDKLKRLGPGILVTWLKGTWVEKDDGSFVEEHPVCSYPWLFRQKDYSIKLDGKELDINNLPDLPPSALKKMEVSLKNHSVNLITKPVQIPAGVKGNINPELTILLTGTPPKDSGAKTTIWERKGIFDGFSWKNFTICSWHWDVDDIGQHLEEVAIRKDHNVRINVCRGVPEEHIERIKRIMREKGVTNFKFVRQ